MSQGNNQLPTTADIGRNFGISEGDAHAELLRFSNANNTKLMHRDRSAATTVVPRGLYDELAQARAALSDAVIPRQTIVQSARAEVPFANQPAIYCLVSGKDLVYIGQTMAITARLSQHLKNKAFDRVALFQFPQADLLWVEGINIMHHMPPLNVSVWSGIELMRVTLNMVDIDKCLTNR